MPRTQIAAIATDDAMPHREPTRIYPEDLEGAIQNALSTLADLETRYEQESSRLDAWSGPAEMKAKLADQLVEMHHRDREPYVHLLAELHRRVVALTMFGGRRTTH